MKIIYKWHLFFTILFNHSSYYNIYIYIYMRHFLYLLYRLRDINGELYFFYIYTKLLNKINV